jgi:hypothetical protein
MPIFFVHVYDSCYFIQPFFFLLQFINVIEFLVSTWSNKFVSMV